MVDFPNKIFVFIVSKLILRITYKITLKDLTQILFNKLRINFLLRVLNKFTIFDRLNLIKLFQNLNLFIPKLTLFIISIIPLTKCQPFMFLFQLIKSIQQLLFVLRTKNNHIFPINSYNIEIQQLKIILNFLNF